MAATERQARLIIIVAGIVVIIVVLVLVGIEWWASRPVSPPPPPSIGLTQTGSSNRTTALPLTAAGTWGVGQNCTVVSPCQIVNFTLSASSGLTTGDFGFKILTTTGATVPGWVVILWNAHGTTPLAAFSQDQGNWSAAHGQTLPISGLQDDGAMLITAPGTTFIDAGDTLSAFGSGLGTICGCGTTL